MSNDPAPRSLGAWMMSCRPKTWGVALAPVIVGTAFAWAQNFSLNLLIFAATAILAVCMQAITNMENDAGYTQRKAERSNRKGLPRATSLGLLSVGEVHKAIVLVALLAMIDTFYLMSAGGPWFIAVTIFSVIAAYAYMGGPYPIAYSPFGEATVLLFFGFVATCGTYYLQTKSISAASLLGGLGLGCIASNVLCVNNFRDIRHDASIGRKTLAVCLGEKRFLGLFSFLQAVPYAASAALCLADWRYFPCMIVFAALPKSLRIIRDIRVKKGNELNAVLFSTVKLEVLFALLLSAGALASGFIRMS